MGLSALATPAGVGAPGPPRLYYMAVINGNPTMRSISDTPYDFANVYAPASIPYYAAPIGSPDGQMLAYIDGADNLVLASPDGSDFGIAVRPNGGLTCRYPAWSPDSSKIIFTRLYTVETFEVETGTLTEVIDASAAPRRAYLPTYNFDGTKIVWTNNSPFSGVGNLKTANADGSGIVTADSDIQQDIGTGASWANTQDKIAYGTGYVDPANPLGGIFTINPDGTGKTRINDSGLGGINATLATQAWSDDDSLVAGSATAFALAAFDGTGGGAPDDVSSILSPDYLVWNGRIYYTDTGTLRSCLFDFTGDREEDDTGEVTTVRRYAF